MREIFELLRGGTIAMDGGDGRLENILLVRQEGLTEFDKTNRRERQ